MTLEERAKQVVELLDISDSEGVIEDAILSAVLEEREMMAKLVEAYAELAESHGDGEYGFVCREVAGKIRELDAAS